MSYNHSENYILVLSHDEVVHLKCSMINKMPGEGKDKFANLKAGYGHSPDTAWKPRHPPGGRLHGNAPPTSMRCR